MTTFQTILFALIQAIGTLLPVSIRAPEDFLKAFLGWSAPSLELQYWITLLVLAVLVFYFRFDWLGIFSALLKTLVRPKSLNAAEKTLDQQIVLFLAIAALPGILARTAFTRHWFTLSDEIVYHPFVMIGCTAASFVFLQMGLILNKRLRGLNHLRLIDAVTLGALLVLSAHPAFSVLLLTVSALAMTHYHSEAIFKYSLLILTLFLATHAVNIGTDLNMGDTLRHIGIMNVIVVTVLALTCSWLSIENVQKNFTLYSFERSFKFFRWVQFLIVIGYGVILFLQRGNI